MSVSLNLSKAGISSLAERIAQARRLYGADSSYIIGLFAGIDWLLVEGEEAEAARRQIRDRVLEIETGQTSTSTPAPDSSRGRGEASALAENTWIRGSVKWFNNDKGYGFISTDSDTDVFVHWRDISSWDRGLTQGDEVEFMVTKTAKGFQAINVMKGDRGEEQKAADGGTPHPQRPEGGAGESAPAVMEEVDGPASGDDAGPEDAGAPDGNPSASEGSDEGTAPEDPSGTPPVDPEIQTQPDSAS